jgi:serine/threonine protein kinase
MPDRIGRYRIDATLGSGAFATVYKGSDELLGAQVAIKVLADNWGNDADVRRRFVEEARILWQLDSDRIVRVHTVDEWEGRPYFVMEYADRGSLADRIRARPGQQFSVSDALSISRDIAESLAVAHALGIVHRDLKPSNVLYRSVSDHHRASGTDLRAERLLLADFGISRAMGGGQTVTIAAGTPHYMAPEQAEGHADTRSDIYAAGAILYQLLSGSIPYPFDSIGAVLRAQYSGPPPSLRSSRPEIPSGLDETVLAALASDPDQRPSTAHAWIEALLRGQAGGASGAFGPTAGATMSRVEPEALPAPRLSSATPPPVGQPSGPPAGPPRGPAVPPVPAMGVGGPPSGRPPGPPGGPPPGGPSPPSSPQKKNRKALALLGVGVIAVVALLAVLLGGGSKKASASEIILEPVDSPGRSPFLAGKLNAALSKLKLPQISIPGLPNLSGSSDGPKPSSSSAATTIAATTTASTTTTIPTGAIPSVRGNAPGLYGGTGDQSACDVQQLVDFLRTNVDKGKAWAQAQGIDFDSIGSFISDLTATVLTFDTRVTNHGFKDGKATALQSILQKGTAVLIDKFGQPRARCACGNPLLQPEPVSAPKYTGPQWVDFVPEKVVSVAPALEAVKTFTLTDVTTAQPVQQPAGTKIDVPGTTAPPATTVASTTTTTTTTRLATTTAARPAVNIAREGTLQASSIFDSTFPASLAFDGNLATSWFSLGDKEGQTSKLTWIGARDDLINTVKIYDNSRNANADNRIRYGFGSVKVTLFNAAGAQVFDTTVPLPNRPDGDQTIAINQTGKRVELLFTGHDDPACGGIAELEINALR